VRRALALLVLGAGACSGEPPQAAAPEGARVVAVSARRFEYQPSRITLKVGQPVVLELTTRDRKHGFKQSQLGLRAEIVPGRATRLAFTPLSAGTFPFACSLFCGDGHEDMGGELVVEP
jgi:cytochrome c oxidase subunit II